MYKAVTTIEASEAITSLKIMSIFFKWMIYKGVLCLVYPFMLNLPT
jgi:hypothetical protein